MALREPTISNMVDRFLKKLHLQSMAGMITQMGAEFHGYGGFPSLQVLYLNRIMPRLPRIQKLKISIFSGSLLSCVGRLTSLSVLKVENMNDMSSFPSGCIRNLTSLKQLEIRKCRQLQSLPGDELQYLEMLRSMIIENCDNLASFPSEVGRLNSPCFLQFLTICGVVKSNVTFVDWDSDYGYEAVKQPYCIGRKRSPSLSQSSVLTTQSEVALPGSYSSNHSDWPDEALVF
ncbi:hypothetical protein ZIOFF_030045 [Zingiber officinale]|uniref:Uncharacterized protein n=1 Tax=Zingiber officinale TaxID=94328 RepID=A0A8J5GUS8_ZINOF|nr:hypothetical protein ZIOFF_030045 [Zingiber officinale]